MAKSLFIGMLLSWCSVVFANDTKPEPQAEKKVKVARCEIIGTNPVQGGEVCQFHEDYVVVERCVGSPCKMAIKDVRENSKFECPEGKPNTPGFMAKAEADRRLGSYYRKRAEVLKSGSWGNEGQVLPELYGNQLFYVSNKKQFSSFAGLLNRLSVDQKAKLAGKKFLVGADDQPPELFVITPGFDFMPLELAASLDACPVPQKEDSQTSK